MREILIIFGPNHSVQAVHKLKVKKRLKKSPEKKRLKTLSWQDFRQSAMSDHDESPYPFHLSGNDQL